MLDVKLKIVLDALGTVKTCSLLSVYSEGITDAK